MIGKKGEGGGGTCLYIREDLEYEINCNVVNGQHVEIQSVELLGKKDGQEHKTILIVLVYRPPNSNGPAASNAIREYVLKVDKFEKKEIVIMGDMNWDVTDDSSSGIKYVTDLADHFGLTQVITMPTRITNSSSTIIDVIMTNIKNLAFTGCINYRISDHYPVFIVKKRLSNARVYEHVYKRSFKSYDKDIFQENLQDLDWSLLDLLEVDEMWQMVVNAMLYEADSLCPYKWIKVNSCRPIWFTSQMNELACDRDILFRNYRRGHKKKQ